MARRSTLLVAILLVALAPLAPMAAMTDSCPGCGSQQGCCPALGCACCIPSSSILTASARIDLGLLSKEFVGDPPADRCLSAAPRGVFHVPKSSPA